MSELTKTGVDSYPVDISSGDDDLSTGGGPCRGLLIKTGGDVKLETLKGNIRTMPMVTGWNPFGAKKIYQADTTAVGIHAIY